MFTQQVSLRYLTMTSALAVAEAAVALRHLPGRVDLTQQASQTNPLFASAAPPQIPQRASDERRS